MRSPALSVLLLLLSATRATAQQCPGGRPVTGQLGIERFECRASTCFVNRPVAGGLAHDFSVEPSIHLAPDYPVDGPLRDGDVLVSVDGLLVTTPEGGRRLANLPPGAPVFLVVRRAGREITVRVVVEGGCGAPRLVVQGGAGAPAGVAAPIWFGMELDCARCGWEPDGRGGFLFRSEGPVRVRSVSPGGPAARAGVLPGDTLLAAGGHALGSPEAALLLGAARAGSAVAFRVRRDGRTLAVSVVPAAPAQDEI